MESNVAIKVFEKEDLGKIRTADIDNKIFFCGSDVAKALGYARPADAITSHCKGVCVLPTPSAGGVQKTKFISEGDVYRLITHSKLPSAERFESWVFDEVLPTLRSEGAYVTKGSSVDTELMTLRDTVSQLQNIVISLTAQKVPNEKALNIWKKHIATPLVTKLVNLALVKDGETIEYFDMLHKVYDQMSKKFGFCTATAIAEFSEKYDCDCTTTQPSIINAIADNPIYQTWFVQTCNQLIDDYTMSECLSVTRSFTTEDKYSYIISTLANAIGDNTARHMRTMSIVYNRMNSDKGWSNQLTRKGVKSKKEVILMDRKQFIKFVKAANEVMKENRGVVSQFKR